MLTRRPLWHHLPAAVAALVVFCAIMALGVTNPSNWMEPFECIGMTPEYCEVSKQSGSNGQYAMAGLALVFVLMVIGASLTWWSVPRLLGRVSQK